MKQISEVFIFFYFGGILGAKHFPGTPMLIYDNYRKNDGADLIFFCVKRGVSMRVIFTIIHTIHRFKSSDWLKEGHMTWVIFDNVHVWKLIHVC